MSRILSTLVVRLSLFGVDPGVRGDLLDLGQMLLQRRQRGAGKRLGLRIGTGVGLFLKESYGLLMSLDLTFDIGLIKVLARQNVQLLVLGPLHDAGRFGQLHVFTGGDGLQLLVRRAGVLDHHCAKVLHRLAGALLLG
jgi:hypothetical protein